MATYMRCNHCRRLQYCQHGLCSDCAQYERAGGFFGLGNRPTCQHCNGTGKVTHVIGPATPCPYCNGTGKQ